MTRGLVGWMLAAAAVAWCETIRFDSDKPGAVPAAWRAAMTHEGGAPKWEVVADATAPSKPNVLAQTSTDNTPGRFPLAIYQKASIKNGAVSVKFKPVSGARDQAAGIVWRYKDPDNYYIVRANALEDNVVLYKVEGGKRISLAPQGTPSKTYGVKHPVPKQKWSELQVRFAGGRFEVFFDGAKVMQVEDTTFQGAGKVGLWTKADSVTWFDDFKVER
ncbi:MAG: family 16 glycoside hydrolase [Bryobacteraceae bacterium]